MQISTNVVIAKHVIARECLWELVSGKIMYNIVTGCLDTEQYTEFIEETVARQCLTVMLCMAS